jgi:hypothetical protein
MKTLAQALLALGAACLLAAGAQAQSSCASDGTQPPTRLVERFINAGCEACWGDAATPTALQHAAVLDWIAPNAQGDDAPLSAAALREATWRLQALETPLPAKTATVTLPVVPGGPPLRVAHGLAVNGYVGASVTLTLSADQAKQAEQQGWSVWLAVVETIAAGSDGTPLARNLVRNTLQPRWNWLGQPANAAGKLEFADTRPMNLPEGVKPERLAVVGWVQDRQGRVLAAAQSHCEP